MTLPARERATKKSKNIFESCLITIAQNLLILSKYVNKSQKLCAEQHDRQKHNHNPPFSSLLLLSR